MGQILQMNRSEALSQDSSFITHVRSKEEDKYHRQRISKGLLLPKYEPRRQMIKDKREVRASSLTDFRIQTIAESGNI